MPDGYPTDDELRAADMIVLIDESLPGWSLPLFTGQVNGKKSITTIQIKVQAHQRGVLSSWRERIQRLREADGSSKNPNAHQ